MDKNQILTSIKIINASEHNLKNVSVIIPKNALVVITGPSGSGKSSLALDVLYTEGRRRYVESLSSYARQFLGNLNKPAVESIEGLCPAIAIEQKTVGSNSRSTVGTITEIYDYLRVLFSRIGTPHCYKCKNPIVAHSTSEITDVIVATLHNETITIAAPVIHKKKGEFTKIFSQFFENGYSTFRVDGILYKIKSLDALKSIPLLKKTITHSIDIILDTITVSGDERTRIFDSINKASQLASGKTLIIDTNSKKETIYSTHTICITCNISIPTIEPRFFSFNSPLGACELCLGTGKDSGILSFLGSNRYENNINTEKCPECLGTRLGHLARAITVAEKSITDLCDLSINELKAFFETIQLKKLQKEISITLITEIIKRLHFLTNIGLSYLTLNRSADTLSGGEGQRIRLATQLGSALSGVLYVLDEPSIGLHQRDNDQLIKTLQSLRDYGNTVIVVEHDHDTIEAADYVIDMGPGAGKHGGTITASGNPNEIKKNQASLTGLYISGKKTIPVPDNRRIPSGFITLENISKNNIKNLTVSFPKKVMCGVSGVSGSGKSTLVMDIFAPYIKNIVENYKIRPADLQNLVIIDQAPIGRTPRSNPATYLGIFNDIRKLFASLPESNARGYTQSEFSFNTGNGRCAKCSGDGILRIEMHFLPPVEVICDGCNGKRYIQEILEIRYKGKSISDILAMTAEEAVEFFMHHKTIVKRLQLMCDVGLDYIALGQQATTLSGGEAQRIKLVDELAKRGSDTMYILDEPTTGLHISDIEKLLYVLNRLVNKGNSMIIIEHNLDLLKCVDYIIDMGPEAGKNGGIIVAQGTPEEIIKQEASKTGFYLKKYI